MLRITGNGVLNHGSVINRACTSVAFRPASLAQQRRCIVVQLQASMLPEGPTVSVDWLHANLSTVKVLDATWYLPTVGAFSPANSPTPHLYHPDKDPVAEFTAARVPGSRFFDLEGISDRTSPLPHMLPSPSVRDGGYRHV